MNFPVLTDLRTELQSALSSLASIEANMASAARDLRETELRLRRARSQFFPKGYFSDVAWDILLELDRAERLGRVFSISDLGADTAVPLSTLLRYVIKLEADGFAVRQEDPSDGRRVLVHFTEAGRSALNSTFDGVISANCSARSVNSSANAFSIELVRSA